MAWFNWSQTASSNASADPTINWAEGQAPSSINDSARAMMAATAKYRDDIAGAIVTGGSSTAYTMASYSGFDTLAHLNNQMIAFSPHTTNGATVLLNVDGLGQKPLRSAPNVELQAGTIIQGTPYVATYNNTDGAFYLQGFFGNAYNIPLAGGMDFWGSTVPNSSFAFPIGQAISRTTYSALFGLVGTAYGIGDGSTTFNLPDKTGRVSAMIEASATRLPSTYFTGNSTVLGANGGTPSETIVTANLPPYTPTGTNGGSTGQSSKFTIQVNDAGTITPAGGGSTAVPINDSQQITIGNSAPIFTGTAQGGISTPLSIVQPTIVCNYIMRII